MTRFRNGVTVRIFHNGKNSGGKKTALVMVSVGRRSTQAQVQLTGKDYAKLKSVVKELASKLNRK